MNRDEYIAEGIVMLQEALAEDSQIVNELATDLASHIQAYGATGNQTIDNLVLELLNATAMDDSNVRSLAQHLIDILTRDIEFDEDIEEGIEEEEEEEDGEHENDYGLTIVNGIVNQLSNRATLNNTTRINELLDEMLAYMESYDVDMNEVINYITDNLHERQQAKAPQGCPQGAWAQSATWAQGAKPVRA